MGCANKRDNIIDSYNAVNELYESQADFIVFGLCGRTGSGVSTVANILEKDFDDLSIPENNPNIESLYKKHEYNILYEYAKKNWKKFYRIKTSALITATVLQNSVDKFIAFLNDLCKKSGVNINEDNLKKICIGFFNQKMYFDFENYFEIAPTDKKNLHRKCFKWNCTEKEISNGTITKIKISEEAEKECYVKKSASSNINNTDKIKFNYNGTEFWFENVELYRLFLEYKKQRKNKSSFINPFYYYLLKKYIYVFLPKAVSKLWAAIKKESIGLPTIAMQFLGINLRIFRNPYGNDGEVLEKEFLEDLNENKTKVIGYTSISEDINYSIKLLSGYKLKRYNFYLNNPSIDILKNSTFNKHTLVVIDSIKNPYESLYLKQRYSNYYLIGVYTEDLERKRRLENNRFEQSDIEEIDAIEQLSQFKNDFVRYDSNSFKRKPIVKQLIKMIKDNNLYSVLSFIIQNVDSCLESADIFINNEVDNKTQLLLKYNLLKYVSLSMHPGLVLPTNLERCMQIAYTSKLNSGCISRQVGAVITDADYHLLSVGWNQQPEGQLPCSYRNLQELCNHWSPEAYSDFENDDELFLSYIKNQTEEFFVENNQLFKKGKIPYYCFKDLYNKITGKQNQVHPRSLHAEETAFLNLGPSGKMLVKGGCLFTTSSPCELCSKKAKYMGISKIYYVELYSGISHSHVLSVGDKEKRPQFVLFTGAIGRAYMQLYTPLITLKDEHELWIDDRIENVVIKNND